MPTGGVLERPRDRRIRSTPRGPSPRSDLFGRVADLVATCDDAVGPGGRAGIRPGDGPAARIALRHAWNQVAGALSVGRLDPRTGASLLAATADLDRRVLLGNMLPGPAGSLSRVVEAVDRLGTETTTTGLLRIAVATACTLGFDRVMLSRITGPLWAPQRIETPDDPGRDREVVERRRARPLRLDESRVESGIVRRRAGVLAGNPALCPLGRELGATTYVGAPVVVHRTVVGILHADQPLRGVEVGAVDLQLLSAYADGLGRALTCAVLAELDQDLRRSARAVAERPALPRPGDVWGGVAAPEQPIAPGTHCDALTRREIQVLELVSGGASNADIARRLVLSPLTVKAHVKNVLRKIGVTNRAGAVTYWARRQQSGHHRPGP